MPPDPIVTGDTIELPLVNESIETSNGLYTPSPHGQDRPEVDRPRRDILETPATTITRRLQNILHSTSLISVLAVRFSAGLRLLKDRKFKKQTKMLTMAGFIITCLTLWLTISSAKDGHRARLIAEWTAKKDFLEFCQSMDYEDNGCDDARGMSLGPPPNLPGSVGKRVPELSDDHTPEQYYDLGSISMVIDWIHALALLTALATCGLFLSFKYDTLYHLHRLALLNHRSFKAWVRSNLRWGYRSSSQNSAPILDTGNIHGFSSGYSQSTVPPKSETTEVNDRLAVRFNFKSESNPKRLSRMEKTGGTTRAISSNAEDPKFKEFDNFIPDHETTRYDKGLSYRQGRYRPGYN